MRPSEAVLAKADGRKMTQSSSEQAPFATSLYHWSPFANPLPLQNLNALSTSIFLIFPTFPVFVTIFCSSVYLLSLTTVHRLRSLLSTLSRPVPTISTIITNHLLQYRAT
jgi:hypothetical protein